MHFHFNVITDLISWTEQHRATAQAFEACTSNMEMTTAFISNAQWLNLEKGASEREKEKERKQPMPEIRINHFNLKVNFFIHTSVWTSNRKKIQYENTFTCWMLHATICGPRLLLNTQRTVQNRHASPNDLSIVYILNRHNILVCIFCDHYHYDLTILQSSCTQGWKTFFFHQQSTWCHSIFKFLNLQQSCRARADKLIALNWLPWVLWSLARTPQNEQNNR